MSENIFKSRESPPSTQLIKEALRENYVYLEDIRQFLSEEIGETREEWKYYGQKLGWTLKTFLKKRNLFFIGIYDGYFRIAFVFGDKAVKMIDDSDVSSSLKEELHAVKKYAEGRGLSIKVNNVTSIMDIKKLIQIKIQN